MDSYSHEQFQITGIKITTTNKNGQAMQDITEAWNQFKDPGFYDKVAGKLAESIHCVYYNYTDAEDNSEKGYDMLIGYITDPEVTQTDTEITTITVPKQDYKYTAIKWEGPEKLVQAWQEINNTPKSEVNRSFGYDLEMYNLEMTEVYLAVSVE